MRVEGDGRKENGKTEQQRLYNVVQGRYGRQSDSVAAVARKIRGHPVWRGYRDIHGYNPGLTTHLWMDTVHHSHVRIFSDARAITAFDYRALL